MQPKIDRVVLDTNVVLDWLVFADPAAAALAADITAQRVEWIVCRAMRQEWVEVLNRRLPDRWESARQRALATGMELPATQVDAGELLPHQTLGCSDPTDQMFIDLAIARRARWLVSRDRALLKLARRAQPLGLCIVRPADWPGLG